MSNIDIINPTFKLFPVNNNRTAWRPFGLPVILIVPNRRDPVDFPIDNSEMLSVSIVIEGTPREALVAGHNNIGLRYPDREIYSEQLTRSELTSKLIDLSSVTILRDGKPIDLKQAITGDIIDYITSTGVRSELVFVKGADYYDLSDVKIEVETLPSNEYVLSYQGEYYERVSSADEDPKFICTNLNAIKLTNLRFEFTHPGPILEEFYRLTPPPYLSDNKKSADETVGLYRIFTDPLQDIYDEQKLLERVNWVYDVNPQIVPYLSSLLGWDLPYFPKSLDGLRKAVLRQTVKYQNLKGSKRAISDIFRLFGFNILISNLWWSKDGTRLIRPGQKLESNLQDQEITLIEADQVDICINDLTASTDIQFSIPLLYRPQSRFEFDDFLSTTDTGNITIDAYLVKHDTNENSAYSKLKSIADDIINAPADYGNAIDISIDTDGFMNLDTIHDILAGSSLIGYSQLLISGDLGNVTKSVIVGELPPVIPTGVAFDRDTNTIRITLNGYFDSNDDYKFFLFATYKRLELKVPDDLMDRQSNRFDVQVLIKASQEYADPTTLEFAIEFLYRLKAFHSLLNSIRTRIELTETYQVTDMCVGGSYPQRYDTDIGRLQVPPAIIPNIPEDISDCTKLDPVSLGYKPSDLLYRKRVYDNLSQEYDAWSQYDNREFLSNPLSRLNPNLPSNLSSDIYNKYGQDRTTDTNISSVNGVEYIAGPNANENTNLNSISPIKTVTNGIYNPTSPESSKNGQIAEYGLYNKESTTDRLTHNILDGLTDYCYKGRVGEEILHKHINHNNEIVRYKPCNLSAGTGIYWVYPAFSIMAQPGTTKPDNGSKSQKAIFSGDAKMSTIDVLRTSDPINKYLSIEYNKASRGTDSSYLGRLYRSYSTPGTYSLHYSDRNANISALQQQQYLSLHRPSLDITKATMHMPGCDFPMMYALSVDYINTSIEARPWDGTKDKQCWPNLCGSNQNTYLNAHLVYDTNGDQVLVYDTAPYKITSNGLTPDLLNLANDTLPTNIAFSQSDIIHSVYMNNSSGNPAVQFTNVCDFDTNVIDDSYETDNPLFNSHNKCTGSADTFLDYADGYACDAGPFTWENEDIDIYGEVLAALGLDFNSYTGASLHYYKLSSGINKKVTSYRLDCGCLIHECGETLNGPYALNTICSLSQFVDDDNEFDWDSDRLMLYPTLLLNEQLGADSYILNGKINTLLETI